jgi:hypothetical protein
MWALLIDRFFKFQFSRPKEKVMFEKEFAEMPADAKELLREAIAEATGQPVEKIGDGKLLELLAKLLPLFIQFLPLFMADKAEVERKIDDGDFDGVLIALIQSLFPAK